MNKIPKVSIIIPLYVITDRFFKDFLIYNNLNYSSFEILVVCDKNVQLPKLSRVKVKVILTGKKHTGPAEKRDQAIKLARGEVCAFIDDDAYPDPNWLKNAVKWFKNPDIVAVGGPGLTPPEDSFSQKLGGYIIESYLCSGGIQNRFYVGEKRGFATTPKFVVDWPAYNLLARTSILKKIGGYSSTFYGGEDTLLCLRLIKHGRIICDPEVVVYHHRRNYPFGHSKQISSVGIHRGYFFKRYPETSRSIVYLLPTFLTLGLVMGILLSVLNSRIFLYPFLVLLLFFYLLGFLSVKLHKVDIWSALIASFGIMTTHLVYGTSFIKGLLTKRLVR